MTYTDTFGGENINPTLLSYAAYTITANLTLVWPVEAVAGANVAADKIDVSAAAGLSVTLPDANQATVGQDILIRNTGTEDFNVFDADGNTLTVIASNEEWYLWVTDNTSAAGVWGVVQFGVSGGGGSTAASLAGAGLKANSTKLDQNLPTTALTSSYTVSSVDRATVLQNTTGAAGYAFGPAATLTDGFFVYVINAGTGTVILTPNGSETIDGEANKSIFPTESCVVFSDGTNLNTLGYGRSSVTSVTTTSIPLTDTGAPVQLALTNIQLAAQIQNFTGAQTSEYQISYGGIAGYWFIYRNTTGPKQVVTCIAALGDPGGGVQVAQGALTILRSDGTTMSIAFTGAAGAEGFDVGDVKASSSATEPQGWLFLNGDTIGNAASGATALADATAEALFVFLWNNQDNTNCPVSTGRGVSGAADFAADKTLQLLSGTPSVTGLTYYIKL